MHVKPRMPVIPELSIWYGFHPETAISDGLGVAKRRLRSFGLTVYGAPTPRGWIPGESPQNPPSSQKACCESDKD